MGRFWQSLILSKLHPLFLQLPVETIVHDHQQEYCQAIQMSSQNNESGAFVEFMLKAILLALKQHCSTLNGGVNGGVNGGITNDSSTVLSWIEAHPDCHAGDIAENCALSLRTVQRILRLLKQDKRIEFQGAPRKGGYFVV